MGISFRYKDSEKIISIKFKDSYLLLPMPLRKLCNYFSVPTAKTYFPFLLSDIKYIGPFPSFDLFTEISIDKYNEIKELHGDRPWSFREEAIKYCEIDCIALFQVLEAFNNLIHYEFKVNIHGSLTLPSLAMKIYKSSFMPKDTVYQILGIVEWDIR